MVIKTNSNKVIAARREVLEKLVWGHPEDCVDCFKTADCKLHNYCGEYEVTNRGGADLKEKELYPIDNTNLFFNIDPNKCISCNLCVKVCDELQDRSSLEMNNEGYISRKSITSDMNSNRLECNDCGNCVSICPTGALMPKQYNVEFAEMHDTEAMEQKKVKTTCSYCGVGCQLELSVENNRVMDVKPVNVLPNTGLLCVKGKFGFKFINHPDRLKTPLIRKNGELIEATWEEALTLITHKSKELKSKYGGNVFGGLSSARCTNEENYLFQKLIRGGFGTNNIDHCARL
jgi:formate dehydrogenase major subunit